MPTFEFNPLTREQDIAGSGGSLSTPVSIANGGTGGSGSQSAINNLTQASSHNIGDVLTIQTDGDAEFSAPNYQIPEYASDPAGAVAKDVWVLRTESGGAAGSPTGLLLAILQTTGATNSYQLSYKTAAGSIVRVALT